MPVRSEMSGRLVMALTAVLILGAVKSATGQEASNAAVAKAAGASGSAASKATRRTIQTIPPAPNMELVPSQAVTRAPVWVDVEQRLKANQRQRTEWGRNFEALSGYYQWLASPQSSGSKSLEEHLQHLAKWREELPRSSAARIVAAKALTRHAWEARGSGVAATVTEEGWKLFAERIGEAHRLLDEAFELGVQDGEAYARLLNLAYAEGVPREVADRWLAAGMKHDPTYFDMYNEMAVYLMPRWAGEPGDIEQFANDLAEKIPGDDGLEAFARVALTIQQYECGWGETLIRGQYDHETLVKAAEVLLKRYPKGDVAAHFAALCATIAQDHAAAKRIRPFVGPYKAEHKIWVWEPSVKKFLDWSSAAESPRGEENWVFAGMTGNPSIAFGNEDRHVWVAQQYGSAAAHMLDVRTGAIELSLPSAGGVVNGFVFDPARQWAVYSAWRGPLTGWALWDLSGVRAPIVHETKEMCRALILHPREPIVYWAEGQTVRSWHLDAEKEGPEIAAGEHVHQLVISPDGAWLAANATVIETSTGTVKHKLGPGAGRPRRNVFVATVLAIDNDGRTWATGTVRGQGQGNPALVRTKTDSDELETVIAALGGRQAWLSPDRKLLVTTSHVANGPSLSRIDVWNVASGERVTQFPGHWNSINQIVFSASGRKLASIAMLADVVKTWSLDGLVD
jgi:hypothetical protein